MTNIRTRFAPSPTGYMHIGNLRSALYGYLLAKSFGGKFILRIEDTDQKRFVKDAEKVIYETLKLAGINYDEGPDIGGSFGPYVQSKRKEIYKEYAGKLLKTGNAYYCFCEKKELGDSGCNNRCRNISDIKSKFLRNKEYVIRQKIHPEGKTNFNDLVFGNIEVENSELEDQILVKSDGLPTYNFANVVDDHLMKITHVIRGCEYLSSTPKYILLYKAFGWNIPNYGHLPLIMDKNSDGTITKLSKRKGAVSFAELINDGYLPEAIVNYVALLGWCPGSTREIFSLHDLEKEFSIDKIGKSSSIFDYDKLLWVNSQHIKSKSIEVFSKIIEKYVKYDVDLLKIAKILQPRVKKLSQIPDMIDFLKFPKFDKYLFVKNKIDPKNVSIILEKSLKILKNLKIWNNESIYNSLVYLAEDTKIKKKAVMWTLRIAVSGKEVTPGGATEIMEIIGKLESIKRVDESLKNWMAN
ncbi:MAG: glutamate--tRNA ligase [Firmicutes bacterium]|nr:glutamate--tRNA ligase [Bacillota bacterium]